MRIQEMAFVEIVFLLLVNVFVILVCAISTVLCLRSTKKARALMLRTDAVCDARFRFHPPDTASGNYLLQNLRIYLLRIPLLINLLLHN